MPKAQSTRIFRHLLDARPENREQLRQWITLHTGLFLPAAAVCPGHDTPLDYLEHVFFEREPADTVVWACRGGGKTTLGALATLLDLLFKPGIQIRILGGSLEQSDKMYACLRSFFAGSFARFLAAPPTRRRLTLINRSMVEILAQSDRAVRGSRVQKIRCDELDLFQPEVWRAAQLATRTLASRAPTAAAGARDPARKAGAAYARGAIEVFSTMHKAGGLMQMLLEESAGGGSAPRKVFRWCLRDIIARCHKSRACAGCSLWGDCRGEAKQAAGFLPVADALTMQRRVSLAVWRHEMLCHPPRLENGVFSAFDRGRHVRAWPGRRGGRPAGTVPAPAGMGGGLHVEALIAGVDFGYSGAFVCLWIAMLRDDGGRRMAWVLEELVTRERTLQWNIAAMLGAGAPGAAAGGNGPAGRAAESGVRMPGDGGGWNPSVVYCDVAGRGSNSHTGRTDESLLRSAGFRVKSGAMAIEHGVALLREYLEPAAPGDGPRLLVDPGCVALIAALEGYRRKPDGSIEKDGRHDHLIDALRYAVVNNEDSWGKVEMRKY